MHPNQITDWKTQWQERSSIVFGKKAAEKVRGMNTALSTASSAYGPDRPSAAATGDNATPQDYTYHCRNSVQTNGASSAFNRMLSALRTIVEHPFRVVKRQFGYVKVRYRGLTKNTGQIVPLFALVNLWLARKRLLPAPGKVRP